MLTDQAKTQLFARSKGQLTCSVLDNLQLPRHESQVFTLGLLACRLVPAMPKLLFSSVDEALDAIEQHYSTKSVTVRVNHRTDKLIDLLLLTQARRPYVAADPFTHKA